MKAPFWLLTCTGLDKQPPHIGALFTDHLALLRSAFMENRKNRDAVDTRFLDTINLKLGFCLMCLPKRHVPQGCSSVCERSRICLFMASSKLGGAGQRKSLMVISSIPTSFMTMSSIVRTYSKKGE